MNKTNRKLYTTLPIDKRELKYRERLPYSESSEARRRIKELDKLIESPSYKLQASKAREELERVSKPSITREKLRRLLEIDNDNGRTITPCRPYSEGM